MEEAAGLIDPIFFFRNSLYPRPSQVQELNSNGEYVAKIHLKNLSKFFLSFGGGGEGVLNPIRKVCSQLTLFGITFFCFSCLQVKSRSTIWITLNAQTQALNFYFFSQCLKSLIITIPIFVDQKRKLVLSVLKQTLN